MCSDLMLRAPSSISPVHRRLRQFASALLVLLATAAAAPSARAAGIAVSPDARRALDAIYNGDSAAAISIARTMQAAQPQAPLGYMIEDEALWWNRYCAACEIKYGIAESWKHGKTPGDEAYLALASKVTGLADAQLAKSETAEMHFYAGMGWALKVRVYALRNENRAAARAAVGARREMLRALALDPQMADATATLGMYNYYVDTLSPMVKLLRFFLGIPGGDKELGIKQMETGIAQGVLLRTDIRFILARALRQYDRQYQHALGLAAPLAAQYPKNPLFLILIGNLNTELGRKDAAAKAFHAAQAAASASTTNPACASRARAIAAQFLSAEK
ncbi:MAG TPA: hypothetical protein VN661_11610 [Candidatus Acidoferrales bacterium]|nr:hypothetical protein [Candidatus Acidoferrales bacterium]